MGFMDDYGLDKSQIIAPGRKLAPQGRWNFEIGDAVVRKGTKNKPKDVFLLITYQLSGPDGEPQNPAEERFWMKRNGVYDDTCKQSMGYLDFFLKRAGFPGGLEDPEFSADALVGLKGKLKIEHNKKGDDVYANPREVEFFDAASDDDDSNAFEDDRTETAKAADVADGTDPDEPPAKPARAPRASRQAAVSPAADSPWADD